MQVNTVVPAPGPSVTVALSHEFLLLGHLFARCGRVDWLAGDRFCHWSRSLPWSTGWRSARGMSSAAPAWLVPAAGTVELGRADLDEGTRDSTAAGGRAP